MSDRLKPSKPTIFELLDALQTKNRAYYRSLPEDQKASFHPLLVMKWLATAPSEDQLLLINDIANSKVFALSHTHKNLMMDVLGACTTGHKSRFQWVKRPSKAASALDEVFVAYYGAQVDLVEARRIHSREEVEELCHRLGMQDKEVQAVLKLLSS